MSFLALGLFILACGWNVYRDYLPTRSTALRNAGHPQYFGAALAAGYVFALAICLHSFAASQVPGYVELTRTFALLAPRVDEPKPAPQSQLPLVIGSVQFGSGSIAAATSPKGPVAAPHHGEVKRPDPPLSDPFIHQVAVALWSAVLAFLLPVVLNLPFSFNSRLRLHVGRRDLDDVELALIRAFEQGVSLALTLTSKKFYVGVPLMLDGNNDGKERKWLHFLPIASGYRDEEGRFKFTTAYSSAYEEVDTPDSRLSPSDFRLTIPIQHVVSIQTFDLDFYTQHFAKSTESADPALSEALDEVQKMESQEAVESVEEEGVSVDQVVPGDNLDEEAATEKGLHRPGPAVGALVAAKWVFHLGFTGFVFALPFQHRAAAPLCALLALLALEALMEPASKDWDAEDSRAGWGYW